MKEGMGNVLCVYTSSLLLEHSFGDMLCAASWPILDWAIGVAFGLSLLLS